MTAQRCEDCGHVHGGVERATGIALPARCGAPVNEDGCECSVGHRVLCAWCPSKHEIEPGFDPPTHGICAVALAEYEREFGLAVAS